MTKLTQRSDCVKKSQIFTTAADNQTSVEVPCPPGASARWPSITRPWAGSTWTASPPARRGVPQIEVTFDIDANGIVNVSAKDLGTGKEQHITITSSTNMSKEDIDKAVKEAEQYAAEDQKRKEEVDVRNQGDQVVYQTEKALQDMGDKISAGDKASVEAALNKLKEALKGSDVQGHQERHRRGQQGVLSHRGEDVPAGQPPGRPGRSRHGRRGL